MKRRTLTLRAHALLALAALAVGGWAQASGRHGCASHEAGEPGASHIAVSHVDPASHDGHAEDHAAHVGHAADPTEHGGDAAAHACAGHVGYTAYAAHARHAATDADPAHAAPAHNAPAPGHDGTCTCLGDCHAGAGISLPAYVAPIAPAATESAFAAAVEGDVAVPFRRAAYLLPYATAPPSRA